MVSVSGPIKGRMCFIEILARWICFSGYIGLIKINLNMKAFLLLILSRLGQTNNFNIINSSGHTVFLQFDLIIYKFLHFAIFLFMFSIAPSL